MFFPNKVSVNNFLFYYVHSGITIFIFYSSWLLFCSFVVSDWIDKQLKKKTYKVFLESGNFTKFHHYVLKTEYFAAVIYKITDFISEIKRIVKIKNKDSSTLDIDFAKFQGKARNQLLAMLDGNGNLRSGIWDSIDTQIKKDLGQDCFDALKPLFSKMQVLGIKNVSHKSFKTDYNFNFLMNYDLDNLVFTDFLSKMKLVYGNFGDLYYLTESINSAINKTWTPWLHTLQKANGFDLTHLTVDKGSIDISSLVNSKVQEASELFLDQIKILKNLQFLGLSKVKTRVQNWIDLQLNFYKPNIQSTLKKFANTKIQKIKINDTLYQVDFLLKENNFILTGSQLPQVAKTQLLALAKAKITSQVLEDALLESYCLTIVDNINDLQDKNVFQVVINDKTYSFTELIKPVNKNKIVSLLSVPAKTELATLVKDAITKTQLDTALNTILTSREETAKKTAAKTPQTQKKSNQKKLIIGLSVGGSALALSSLGGFLYWFFKIKK